MDFGYFDSCTELLVGYRTNVSLSLIQSQSGASPQGRDVQCLLFTEKGIQNNTSVPLVLIQNQMPTGTKWPLVRPTCHWLIQTVPMVYSLFRNSQLHCKPYIKYLFSKYQCRSPYWKLSTWCPYAELPNHLASLCRTALRTEKLHLIHRFFVASNQNKTIPYH